MAVAVQSQTLTINGGVDGGHCDIQCRSGRGRSIVAVGWAQFRQQWSGLATATVASGFSVALNFPLVLLVWGSFGMYVSLCVLCLGLPGWFEE